jgi:hypothetical protein
MKYMNCGIGIRFIPFKALEEKQKKWELGSNVKN